MEDLLECAADWGSPLPAALLADVRFILDTDCSLTDPDAMELRDMVDGISVQPPS